ncbi:MAG TPA: hypothetical protein VH079_19175 [Terriglobales bacterium]|nr:hypothetical protein [Terriglobales bacterium]
MASTTVQEQDMGSSFLQKIETSISAVSGKRLFWIYPMAMAS